MLLPVLACARRSLGTGKEVFGPLVPEFLHLAISGLRICTVHEFELRYTSLSLSLRLCVRCDVVP